MNLIGSLAALISAAFGTVAAWRGLDPRKVTLPAFAIFGAMIVAQLIWLFNRDSAMRAVVLALLALAIVTMGFAAGVFGYAVFSAVTNLLRARREMTNVLRKHGVDDDLPLA